LLAGTITVSTQLIELGTDGTTAPVRLTNTGDQTRTFQVSTSKAWLAVSPASGPLAPGGSEEIRVTADRSGLPEGSATGSLAVTWDGGSASVTVRLTQEKPPTVGRPALGRSACGPAGRTVRVSAPVSDDSGLDSVVLRWAGPSGPGKATMSSSGSAWSADMGPFAVGGKVTLNVSATDEQGNSTTGPSTSTNVDPCPQ
jgi:hypothetical protein